MTRRRCVQTLSLPEESCLLGLSTPGARFTTEQLLFPRAQTPHRTYFVTSSRPCVNKSRLRGSYRQSCRCVHVTTGTLTTDCRRSSGSWTGTNGRGSQLPNF